MYFPSLRSLCHPLILKLFSSWKLDLIMSLFLQWGWLSSRSFHHASCITWAHVSEFGERERERVVPGWLPSLFEYITFVIWQWRAILQWCIYPAFVDASSKLKPNLCWDKLGFRVDDEGTSRNYISFIFGTRKKGWWSLFAVLHASDFVHRID